MARTAAVRLTLSGAQFLTEIKRAGDAVEKVEKAGTRGFDLFQRKIDGAARSVGGLGISLKNTLALASGLGGAFTVGGAIKGAVELQRTYRQIAFGVKDAKGQMLQAADVQRIVERSAAAASQKNEEMAKTFRDLLDATGDLEFTKESMAAIGTTALATGESLESIGTVADQLHTKFGVAAGTMEEELAHVFGAAKQGGPKFSEFAEVIATVGADLGRAGLDGKRGLDFMLGALVATDDKAGGLNKQVRGLRALLQSLGDKSQLAKIGNAIGIDPKALINEKDALARMRRIFSKGGAGMKALLATMPVGDERDTAEKLFIEPFQKALTEAQGAGLEGKAAIDQALVTFDGQVRDFGKATMTGAQMQAEAERARKEPSAQLTLALNKLNTAFAQPAIIKAINDLSSHLPALADLVGKVVSFAAAHPIAAGGAAVGGKIGWDALGGLAEAGGGVAGGWLLNKLFKRGAGAGGGGGGGGGLGKVAEALGDAAGGGVQRYHQFGLGGGITAEMLGEGAITAGELGSAGVKPRFGMGLKGLASGARGLANTPLGAAGIFGAIAAAGIAGGVAIDDAYTKEGDVMGELSAANAASRSGGGMAAKRAALARLEAARKAAGDADVGGGFMDFIGRTVTGYDSRKAAAVGLGDADENIARLKKDLARMQANATDGSVRMPEVTITGKPRPVALDDSAPRMIADATKTALGGMVLTVRLATGSGGIGTSSPRSPMNPDGTRPGGGV